mmetsp:Transcript_40996/g.46573  ORF Transcript_40996/g.46573 Transcript_40996/m.46573 type:complete len:156 (-) Transcript_40996:194-661(-)|eukprot:CAMPEP_0194141350 /NCGR_PEP_ID=MMETSP0152-20130528/10764_1 /TAXON_ID=1049557 /ORGANISM="Thalassiothrix antarctica, Strain L6-D1" /LENGTH=155 /DNA_ID=CAMNT_0038839937 /DNA_START=86 /DNA_END=553 /DNA_ORIENTATION=-
MTVQCGFGGSSSGALTSIEESTPWMAASEGNLELLQNSIETLNITPSTGDKNGYTLVHAAAAYNQTSILEWLLQCNVNANAQDNDGDTPLHHVEHVEAAKVLVEKMEANPNLVNSDSKTALQLRMGELQEQIDDPNEDEDEDLRTVVEYLKALSN